MEKVKINGTEYPATIEGQMSDYTWDGRESKTITLEMTHAEAAELFVDGARWSIISENVITITSEENPEEVAEETVRQEFDNSDYSLAGAITDYRDGTISVKMGKSTELEEAYSMLFGGEEDE